MKVLLINNNPVVGKLVTLSAQKTGDELRSVHSVDEVPAGEYDFVLMDDAGYSDDLLDELRTKAEFSKSCFIGSRSTEKPSAFTHEISKPFLPTDLVDIFIKVSSDTKVQDPATQPSEEVFSDAQADTSEDPADQLDNLEDGLAEDMDDEVIDLEDLDALESLGDDFDDELGLDEFDDDLELEDLEDLSEITKEEAEQVLPSDEEEHQSVLDDDDVKEVQELLVEAEEELSDELDTSLLEDDAQTVGSTFADEAILDEINNALEEIEEEDDAISLDDALDAFKAEETAITAETLGDFDALDLEEEMDPLETSEEVTEQMLEDDDKGMDDLLDGLDLDEQIGQDESEADSDEDMDELLDALDLEAEGAAEEEPEESAIEDEEVLGDARLDELDLLDEEMDEEEDLLELADDEGLEQSELAEEELSDEESLAGLLEEEGLLDDMDLPEEVASEEDEASIAEETGVDELLDEEALADEDLDLDDLVEASELLEEETAEDDDEIAEEEDLDALFAEASDLSDESELLEESDSEETEDEDLFEEMPVAIEDEEDEDVSEIDLSALNDEIEEALSELDEDDLMSELEEGDISSLEDELASLSAADLKIALGEADDEDSEIQEEIEALESSIETEEELGLSVGQSEFASLNKEALSEARGEGLIDESEHPELDEVNAFVDEVAVEGSTRFDMSTQASADESIATLENLISTLKQGDVKEALKGMEMNIKISFSEKSE